MEVSVIHLRSILPHGILANVQRTNGGVSSTHNSVDCLGGVWRGQSKNQLARASSLLSIGQGLDREKKREKDFDDATPQPLYAAGSHQADSGTYSLGSLI
jgi:hypothetical protein